MTLFLPLEASSPCPPGPSFLVPTHEPAAHLQRVVKAILKARRIAVVCGAGISVQAGIPDFRSADGLFQSLKKDNPTLSSGRDLFDASVFNSEVTTSLFCQMIAQLSELSEEAIPTSFHKLLRALDDRGRLLRVYTQNIDALEQKSGLTFGVPDQESKRYKPRSCKGKTDCPDEAGPSTAAETVEPSRSRLLTPPMETPRCIPLHGTLQLMHCQVCTRSFPLRDHLQELQDGKPPYCPECTALEETRALIGKRSRGVGKLRPSVVLYNELHKNGEEVGSAVRRDLIGSSKGKGRAGADLLLVVGTSLRVPGTKRIVREFSKAVHSRLPSNRASTPPAARGSMTEHGLATPTPSPRRSPADDEEPPIKAVYLNLDFPVPTREWEGVFDVWIRGDVQTFARLVQEEVEREERAKEAAVERKRRREEAALAAKLEAENVEKEDEVAGGLVVSGGGKKRKGAPGSGEEATPAAKKRKAVPLTPVSLAKGSIANKGKRKKRGEEDVLPTVRAGQKAKTRSKERLTIKIPPRPMVVITTPPPKMKKVEDVKGKKKCSGPLLMTLALSPPSSPLTSISSRSECPSSTHTRPSGRRRASDASSALTDFPDSDLEHEYEHEHESFLPTLDCNAWILPDDETRQTLY